MTSDLIEVLELGEAESLVEMGVLGNTVEFWDKYQSSNAPYVEFAED